MFVFNALSPKLYAISFGLEKVVRIVSEIPKKRIK
jgi:hypothetical protein